MKDRPVMAVGEPAHQTDFVAGSLVGILGGMGPAASSDFYHKLISATPAATDQEHLPVVLWSDPRIPDRTAALLDGGPDPTPWIESGARHLKAAGCTVIAMPCNSAHAFIEGLEDRVGIPVINMIAETVHRALEITASPRRIGLLATTGTLKSRLYDEAMRGSSALVLRPDAAQQVTVMDTIRAVKAGNTGPSIVEKVDSIIRSLVDRGAETVILGCTELPLLVGDRADVTVLDPTRILAEAVVARAWHPTP